MEMLHFQVITKQTLSSKLINKKKYCGTLGIVVCLSVSCLFSKWFFFLSFKNWSIEQWETKHFIAIPFKHQKVSLPPAISFR